MATNTPGRPVGARNKQLEHADGELTRCKCGSTRRASYFNRQVQTLVGLDAKGRPYTHLVKRRTACLDCGQHRVDRHYENKPAKK